MSVSSTRSEFQPIRYDDLVCLNTHGLVWGQTLASVDRTLLPDGHDAHGMGSLFGLTSFTGSLEVTSTEPIVSLSLNFEADPVFSSLPPGELDAAAQGSTAYYFPHLAVGAGWQTTITYINYSPEEVSCQTNFISDHGSPLMVSFAGLGTVAGRIDVLPPGGSVHQETNVELSAALGTGVAYANPSATAATSPLLPGTGLGRRWLASFGPCCPKGMVRTVWGPCLVSPVLPARSKSPPRSPSSVCR